MYDFSTLSPPEFEDLARDLLGAEMGCLFEGFCSGPDGGIDGRTSTAAGNIVIQAKHYLNSTFSHLETAIENAKPQMDKVQPVRYLLVTSLGLTPDRKDKLAAAMSPWISSTGDIFGPAELNSLLKKHQQVQKSHIKLWLSSSVVLNRLINAASHEFASASEGEIKEKLRLFVPNQSLQMGQKILEEENVLVVSGPPGVGKTTLAQMLAYAYVGEDWQYVAIRNLEDGFSRIDDSTKQVFFFDDFLGQIALDRAALSANDSAFMSFVSRVRKSTNSRFILTTRAYIYEEARSVSDIFGNNGLEMSKLVLDVGVYTRGIRMRILYNHLSASSLSHDHLANLLTSVNLVKIVDHKNYNPRVIEWMTGDIRTRDIAPIDYFERFMSALENPEDLWRRAFTEHIPRKSQHLLLCLYFSRPFGESISFLRYCFTPVHLKLCGIYGVPHTPHDFEEALRILEGSFVNISKKVVSFINPSIRDYLHSYTNNIELLKNLGSASPTVETAVTVWKRFLDLKADSAIPPALFVENFFEAASRLATEPVPFKNNSSRSVAKRLELLNEWTTQNSNEIFRSAVIQLASNAIDIDSQPGDAHDLVSLIVDYRIASDDGTEWAAGVADNLEAYLRQLVELISDGYEFSRVAEEISTYEPELQSATYSAMVAAAKSHLNDDWGTTYSLGSVSDAEEYAVYIEDIGRHSNLQYSSALEKIEEHKESLESEDNDEEVGHEYISEDEVEHKDLNDDEMLEYFLSLFDVNVEAPK